jgi:uncharacterized cupin superfamily protein
MPILNKAFAVSVALNIALVGALVYELGDDATHAPPASVEALKREMRPMQVNPAWIKSGTPKFMAAETSHVNTVGVTTGLWSCDGPGTFEWTYGTDETIHLLEGAVEIDYLGKTLKLGPGDTAFFRAGTKATWTVRERAYKSFILHDPGRLARLYRRVLGV